MLTDIFANRYAGVNLWQGFEEKDRRFLVQAFRIISEQLFRYWTHDRKENPITKAKWQLIHDKLSMELGLEELSKKAYTYPVKWQGNTTTQVGFYTLDTVCKNFVLAEYDGSVSADRFMKERISLVEIAFRERAEDIKDANAKLPQEIRAWDARQQAKRGGGIRLPGDRAAGMRAFNAKLNEEFRESTNELNTRFKQAGYDLNYHNGFIQRSTDPFAEEQIESPFWSLVSDATWQNVDTDMKEAIDRRDNGDRDPAFYAARALESTIKIVSDKNGWSHGGEKGAHNYIDNLGSKNAGLFITDWEREALKNFFSHIRNPLGHGPGSKEMPALGPQQNDWAIEYCMSWIKSLIRRMH